MGGIDFQYYYGMEAEQYAFYRIPKILITDPHFKSLSTDAKLLYGLMLDRMSLSVKNGWLDDENRVFIYFATADVIEQLCCGNDKAIKLMAELDSVKGIGLIERVRQGQGRPSRIYVKRFTLPDVNSDKQISRDRESRLLEVGKTDFKTSEKPTSRNRENRSPEVGKTDPNNTEFNNTEFSKPNLSIHQARSAPDVMDVDVLREEIRENIEYEHMTREYQREDLDGIVELILEILCRPGDTIRISGADFPAALVKDRFRSIGQAQVEYVLDCLRKNTTKVRNIKAYLLASLYNSPPTIGPYYQAEVNHDFYGKD